MQVYHEDFASLNDVESEFCVSLAHEEDFRVLFAVYTQEDYEGDAFVVFEQHGKLYEVHGGHCSCHGLEGQWEPEETSAEALLHQMISGTLFRGCKPSDLIAELEDRVKS